MDLSRRRDLSTLAVKMRTLKRRRRRAGADSNCASVLAAVGSHQRPSFPQVGTPGPIKCKGKVPKLINKDLLSNSRERGSLPVGPHPRLFLQVDYSGRRFGALQRPFRDRAGTQNSDLGDYQLRQHLREACLTGVTAGSVVSLVGPLDVQ